MKSNAYFDFHVSAESIDQRTIDGILALGFEEDFLRNNLNSEPPHFHASFKSHYKTANDDLWHAFTRLAANDPTFRGCLEEERQDHALRAQIGGGSINDALETLSPFEHRKCHEGEHKVCDLHIAINSAETQPSTFKVLDALNFISFERMKDGHWVQIYSLTFASIEAAQAVFNILHNAFSLQKGLSCKMKIEIINRFRVMPESAQQLPITDQEMVERWLELNSEGETV